MRRTLSTALAACLVWLSPGLGAYEALAQSNARRAERASSQPSRFGVDRPAVNDNHAEDDVPTTIELEVAGPEAISQLSLLPTDAASAPRDLAVVVDAVAPTRPTAKILAFPRNTKTGEGAVSTAEGSGTRQTPILGAISSIELTHAPERVSELYGEHASAGGSAPGEIGVGAGRAPPTSSVGLKNAGSVGEDGKKEYLYRVHGIERPLAIGPLGTLQHYEFKFSAIIFKSVLIYFGALSAGLGPIGAAGLVSAYYMFYPIKGPAFLLMQSQTDMTVRTRLTRFPGLDGYWKLKGMPNPRILIGSIPGVTEVVELVDQKDESRGFFSFWGMFHNRRILRYSYLIKSDRELTADDLKLPRVSSAKRGLARILEHAVEATIAGLNPYLAPTLLLGSLKLQAALGLALPAFILSMHVPIWLLWAAPPIAMVWFVVRQLSDRWPRREDHIQVDRVSAEEPLRVDLAQGTETLAKVKRTTVGEFMNSFLDPNATREAREKSDPRWFAASLGLLSQYSLEALVVSLPFKFLDTFLSAVFHLHVETHLSAAVFLTWFILRYLGHKVHAAEMWKGRTGLWQFLGQFWKKATKEKSLVFDVLSGGERWGAIARGYGLRTMLGNGIGQQLKVFLPYLAAVALAPAGLLYLGFSPEAAVMSVGTAALALFAARGFQWREAGVPLMLFGFAAALLFGVVPHLTPKSAAWIAALASVISAREIMQARHKRLGISPGPAEGLATPHLKYLGKRAIAPEKISLGTAALVAGALWAALHWPILAPALPLMLLLAVLIGHMLSGLAVAIRNSTARVKYSNGRDPNRPDLLSSVLSAISIF